MMLQWTQHVHNLVMPLMFLSKRSGLKCLPLPSLFTTYFGTKYEYVAQVINLLSMPASDRYFYFESLHACSTKRSQFIRLRNIAPYLNVNDISQYGVQRTSLKRSQSTRRLAKH